MQVRTGKGRISMMVVLAIWSLSLAVDLPGLAVTPIEGSLKTIFTDATDFKIQLLTVLPNLVIIPFVLMSGWLSQTKHKILIITLGTVLYIVAGALSMASSSLNALIWLSCLLGAGCGLILPFSTGLVADVFTGKYRMKQMGIISAIGNIALVGATFVVGFLATRNWHLPFLVYLIPLISLILIPFLKKIPQSDYEGQSDDPAKQGLETGAEVEALVSAAIAADSKTDADPSKVVADVEGAIAEAKKQTADKAAIAQQVADLSKTRAAQEAAAVNDAIKQATDADTAAGATEAKIQADIKAAVAAIRAKLEQQYAKEDAAAIAAAVAEVTDADRKAGVSAARLQADVQQCIAVQQAKYKRVSAAVAAADPANTITRDGQTFPAVDQDGFSTTNQRVKGGFYIGRTFWLLCAYFFFVFATSIPAYYLPDLMPEYNMTTDQVSIVTSIFYAAMFVIGLVVTQTMKLFRKTTFILAGALVLVALGMFWFTQTMGWYVFAAVLLGLGNGLAQPIFYDKATEICVSTKQATLALAYLQVANYVAISLVPVITNLFMLIFDNHTNIFPFAMITIMMALVFIAIIVRCRHFVFGVNKQYYE